MFRSGTLFIALCIALIAASIGAGTYFYFGLSAGQTAVVVLAVLTGLALYNRVSSGLDERPDIETRIAQLSGGTADLARQVADIGRRLAVLEDKIEGRAGAAAGADPILGELSELGMLFKQLAETVAAHDAHINGLAVPDSLSKPVGKSAGVPLPKAPTLDMTPPLILAEPVASPLVVTATPEKPAVAGKLTVERVRAAVEAGRIDLYLQPIVTLPQRKVRYYEALSRLRLEDGGIVAAADFLAQAEAGGVIAKIDNLALFRSVQVARRLMLKNSEIGLFCNIAGAALADAEFVPQLIEFAEANRALASALIFEVSQKTARALGPIEQESLAALAERGFRFSIDNIVDLRFEPRELAERGFRFAKVPAALLLDRSAVVGADIHPADFADLLARYGIDLIASHIEAEASVLDLLDFNLRYGQGTLFSAPRPVRQEALRPAPRREGVAPAEPLGNERPAARPVAPAAARSEDGLARLARGAFRPA